jgi:SAM-dependent methyltransferase
MEPRIRNRLAQLDPARRRLVEQLMSARPAAPAPAPAFEEQALESFRSPATRTKAGTRQFYDAINRQLDGSIFGAHAAFLNYGYVGDDSPAWSTIELPRHMLNRASAQLVLELVGDCDLNGQRVLDVGCGRGGTLAVAGQFWSPALRAGVDLSAAAIAFCCGAHARAVFLEGDAEQLPFRDGSFDVVLNVESSHSYARIGAFYAEVRRVLARGGWFLYTDVFPPARFAENLAELARVGFAVERDRDITRNVLLACREIAEQRAHAFRGVSETGVIDDFLSTPGSPVFEEMQSGRAVYRMLKLRRD